MIGIIIEIILFIVLRAKKILLLSVPVSIVVAIVCSIIPGAGTIAFIVLKVKGLLTLSWGWIAVPIILDLMEILEGVFSDMGELSSSGVKRVDNFRDTFNTREK